MKKNEIPLLMLRTNALELYRFYIEPSIYD